jgi:hypothetical protein
MKLCESLNKCPKIRSLRDRDWACDAQFTEAVVITCSKCEHRK